ncbi:MAG: penicillin-binding protein 1C [Gemmatimonadales bacterium]
MTRRRRALLALGLAAGLPALSLLAWLAWPLPRALMAPPPALSLTLEDRHGLTLRSTRATDGTLTRWLSLADVDPQLIQAFVAVEDRRFYSHAGVDARAVARALADDLRGAHVVSGASTITMQLARLLHPSPRDVFGKLTQALWALRIERHLTKQQILEQYLNRVPLGQGASGVASAARLYFDASATRLSLGQAALLAGVAIAPSADNPLADPARARAGRARALDRMVSLGYASRGSADRAAGEPVIATGRRAPFLAPHFTSRVLQWAADSGLALGGTWRTSLDLPLQAALEGEVRHTVASLKDRGVAQAAAVVLDNVSGEVLAWVGSPDFWADTAGQVDMVVSPRQPGSALKPFLYGLAFDRGFSPASVIADVPHVYQTAIGPYQPRNYDRRYHGPVRAREALASSFNLPALALTDRLGAGSLLGALHSAGFASLDRGADYYGIGLALGNGDVTLLELANAYRALARGGTWAPVRWAALPPAAPGSAPTGTRVISRGAAALVLDILSDPIARVPGFGLDTPFDFPFPVAVKTGTSHRFTDNWAVGVTGGFTVAVWVGNFSGRPMRQVSGVTGAGPLLHRAVMDAARARAPGVLSSPADVGAVRVAVCRLSGLRAGRFCPAIEEWVLPGTRLASCDWHRGSGRVTYPAEYAEWVSQHPGDTAIALAGDSRAALSFRIVSPQDGDRYRVPPGTDPRYATIALRAVGSPGAVRWSVDGRVLEAESWRLVPGTHRIEATAETGQASRVTIEVR